VVDQDTAQGAETDTDDTQTGADPNAAADDKGGQQEGASEPGPYDALARDLGWVPQSEFSGPADQWRDAETFIRTGRDIQRDTARELKTLRGTLDNISRTNATILQAEVDRRVAERAAEYQRLVDDGDSAGAFRVANEIAALRATPTTPGNTAPGSEAQDFAQRNASWFQKDTLATAEAVEICEKLSRQGYDHATQLAEAEKHIRRTRPDLFKDQMNGHKPQAGVHRPGARSPQGGGNRQKCFADMPAEAQKVANDLVERGVIKADTADAAKAMYARNYWANVALKG